MTVEIPYVEGFRTGLRCGSWFLCPYDKMTKERREWERGHSAGLDLYREYGPRTVLAGAVTA